MVHGRITITTHEVESKIRFLAGMGAVFDQDEPYSIESNSGAIVLIVESSELTPHARGISTPDRIALGFPYHDSAYRMINVDGYRQSNSRPRRMM